MACNVTCHRCGRSYTAYSRTSAIAYKLRQGKGIYCPQCVVDRHRENMIRVNAEILMETATEWQAPCGKTIIPRNRSRCKKFTEEGCVSYDQCLDFAARQNWQGWRFA